MIDRILYFFKKYRFKSFVVSDFLKYFSMLFGIFFIVISAVAYIMQVKSSENAALENDYQVQRIEDVTDMTFSQVDRIASLLSIDADVNHFIHANKSYYDRKRGEKLREQLIYYKNITKHINSIYVYTPEFERLCTTNELCDNIGSCHEFSDFGFVEGIYTSPGEDTYTVIRKLNRSYPDVISYVKIIRGGGIVVVNVDCEKYIQTVKTSFDYSTEIYIIDNEGAIVFGEGGSRELAAAERLTSGSENKLRTGGSIYTLINTDYCTQGFLVKWDMRPYAANMNSMLVITFLAVLCFGILSVLIAVVLSSGSSSMFAKMYEALENKDTDISDVKDNEGKYIISSIIKLLDENEGFRSELDKRLVQYNESQISVLQKQINPHFINNVLTAINYKIVEEMGVEAPPLQMIVKLTRIIKYGYESEVMVLLSEEASFIDDYVTLLRERFGEFAYETDITPEAASCRIMRLLIQPFVENAVYHGISDMKEKGIVRLSAKVSDGSVVITIEDNGTGMSAAELESLRASVESEGSTSHIGISNVYKRIKIVYPNNHGIQIDSEEGRGTRITLIIPTNK